MPRCRRTGSKLVATALLTGRPEAARSLSASWAIAAVHNGSVADPVEQIVVERADAIDSQRILRAYLDDVVSRYYGRPVTHEEITAAPREFPTKI